MHEIIRHYEDCLLKNKGDLVKESDWDNEENVIKRYHKMIQFYYEFIPDMFALPNDGATTLMDFGCGVGNILESLSPFINYTGYDASEVILDEAKHRHPHENFCIYNGKLDRNYDVIICNGTFTEKLNLIWANMYFNVKQVLTDLWSHTNKGLAFNVMDAHRYPVSDRRNSLFFMSYNDVGVLCDKIGIKNYTIDCSYGLAEFIVKAYK